MSFKYYYKISQAGNSWDVIIHRGESSCEEWCFSHRVSGGHRWKHPESSDDEKSEKECNRCKKKIPMNQFELHLNADNRTIHRDSYCTQCNSNLAREQAEINAKNIVSFLNKCDE